LNSFRERVNLFRERVLGCASPCGANTPRNELNLFQNKSGAPDAPIPCVTACRYACAFATAAGAADLAQPQHAPEMLPRRPRRRRPGDRFPPQARDRAVSMSFHLWRGGRVKSAGPVPRLHRRRNSFSDGVGLVAPTELNSLSELNSFSEKVASASTEDEIRCQAATSSRLGVLSSVPGRVELVPRTSGLVPGTR
jgi:hypothetical protein